MAYRKGFTLIEIIVVLIIVGILATIVLPNLRTSAEQTNAQAAKNNLLAIAAAQAKYVEDYGSYCTATTGTPSPCGDTLAHLSANLRLSIGTNNSFSTSTNNYNCVSVAGSGSCSATYACTAQDSILQLNLAVTTSGCAVTGVTIACGTLVGNNPSSMCPY